MQRRCFIDEIQNNKVCLKPQETIVTSTCGQRYVEKINGDGEFRITKLENSCFGYVVDEKPDLQIAEILPYLFLSSQDVVQHSELLIKNSITHILSIGIDIPSDIFVPHIVYKKVNLLDLPEADITGILNESFDFIEGAKIQNENSKILIHCNAGYSRSPSIIIAYLMKKFGFKLEKAVQVINEKRNIHPNYGFMNQLRTLETQLIQKNIIK